VPQRVAALLDQLRVEFLPAEPRAGVARHHRRQERFGEVGAVVVRAGMRPDR
jgi:hypothetical protein